MIGRNGERRSGISAQAARQDDDDDLTIHRKFATNEPDLSCSYIRTLTEDMVTSRVRSSQED